LTRKNHGRAYELTLTLPQYGIVVEAIDLYNAINSGDFSAVENIELVKNKIKNLEKFNDGIEALSKAVKGEPVVSENIKAIRDIFMTANNKFIITTEQAETLVEVLDLLSRLNIGQFNMLLECPYIWKYGMLEKQRAYLELLVSDIKYAFGLHTNSSFGMPQIPEAQKSYDILCVIRHRLVWDKAGNPPKRDFKTMFDVYYDAPMHWFKEWPLATIKLRE
jgi:hypothetical protein